MVLWWGGEPACALVLGPSGWPPGHGQLQDEWPLSARGAEPTPEPLTAVQVALPLALGADGVMVPFRPEPGRRGGRSAGAKSKWVC